MLYSAYFAERAEHYHKLARMTANGRQAEYQLGLANLFLEMSCDMRLRELGVEPTAQRDQNGTHVISRYSQVFSDKLPMERSISAWST
jgi:hypothetical protein